MSFWCRWIIPCCIMPRPLIGDMEMSVKFCGRLAWFPIATNISHIVYFYNTTSKVSHHRKTRSRLITLTFQSTVCADSKKNYTLRCQKSAIIQTMFKISIICCNNYWQQLMYCTISWLINIQKQCQCHIS